MEKSKISDAFGQEFFFTGIVPGNFADSDEGWSKFSFSEQEMEKHSTSKSTQFGVKGKGGWGPLSFGGSVDSSKSSKKEVSDIKSLSISFSLTQVPLSRPFLDFGFLESRAWRLAPTALEVFELSDGGSPPKGMLVAYPTTVIFARDILIDFSDLHDESSEVRKQLAGEGGGGWGPFKLGWYKRDKEEKRVKQEITKNGLEVKGMQVIGFRCRLLGKTPNPLPDIKEFV